MNLADELRGAIQEADAATVVQLLALLGTFWAIRGEHARVIGLIVPVGEIVQDWMPPPELGDAARAAMGITLIHAMVTVDQGSAPLRALLERLGAGSADARLAGMVTMVLAYDPGDPASLAPRLERLAESPDRGVALPAQQWLSHVRENAGEAEAAIETAERALALVVADDGPWTAAILHMQLAQMIAQRGELQAAIEHARAAIPVMQQVGATDDEIQVRSLLALCAIAGGQLVEAESELDRIDAIDNSDTAFGGIGVRQIGRAELSLARGDHARGLALYREAAADMSALRLPGIPTTGVEPWALFAESAALAAHAHHASSPEEVTGGCALYAGCRARALRVLDPADPHLDFPVAGVALFALGTWGLLRDTGPRADSAELLALAERFAYSRTVPTLAWERIAPRADELAPGVIAARREHYGDARPVEFLGDALALVERLPG